MAELWRITLRKLPRALQQCLGRRLPPRARVSFCLPRASTSAFTKCAAQPSSHVLLLFVCWGVVCVSNTIPPDAACFHRLSVDNKKQLLRCMLFRRMLACIVYRTNYHMFYSAHGHARRYGGRGPRDDGADAARVDEGPRSRRGM